MLFFFFPAAASGCAGLGERSAESPPLVSVPTGLCQTVREDGVIDFFFFFFLCTSFQVTALLPPIKWENVDGRPNTFEPSS